MMGMIYPLLLSLLRVLLLLFFKLLLSGEKSVSEVRTVGGPETVHRRLEYRVKLLEEIPRS